MGKNIFSLLFLLLTVTVYGQGFTGPGSEGQIVTAGRIITVSEAKNLSNDSWVVLSGNIINMLPGGRQYTFRDVTGDIAVDIGPKEWRGLSVDAADNVEIYGEVKINRGQVHIKVHAIIGTGRQNNRAGQAVTITYPITITEAMSLPHESFVVLAGNIINKQPNGKNNYTFSDATGEIRVDIGVKEWRGLSVGIYDRVEIYGEVKVSRSETHIKVHAIGRAGV